LALAMAIYATRRVTGDIIMLRDHDRKGRAGDP
jgi:hypothetical protein